MGIGLYLVEIRCNIVSSVAIRRTLPNISFTARYWCTQRNRDTLHNIALYKFLILFYSDVVCNVIIYRWCAVVRYVNQLFDRLPQQLVDRVLMRSFTSIFSSHYKTTALRAGELTVNTLAPVSKSWWKAVNRWSTSASGRHLRRTTRRQLDGNNLFIHSFIRLV